MAFMAAAIPWLTAAGGVLGAAGNAQSGKAAKVAGQRQRVANQFEAEQMDQQAIQSVAVAQRDAREEERRSRLLASRALAVSAAGGGASDPTTVRIIADIEGEGAYRAGVAMYRGEDEARRLRMAASAKRYEGEVAAEGGQLAQSSYNLAAGASVLKAGSSLYGKYG